VAPFETMKIACYRSTTMLPHPRLLHGIGPLDQI
jgi:hypothetical protein